MDDETAMPGLSLRDGMDLSGMSVQQLWLRYIGLGGCETPTDIQHQLLGTVAIGDHEHNLLAQAINEHFIERGQDHPVHYRGALSQP